MTERRAEYRFDVDLPQERVWQVMADTQHLNQLVFGLSATTLVARDGEKARLRGTFGVFAPEYDEYPWVFEVPRRYKSLRVFTRGLLRRLETECTLEPTGGGTRVCYRSLVEPIDGPLGAIAGLVTARRIARGMRAVQGLLRRAAVTAGAPGPLWPPANPWREAVLARARPIAAAIPDLDDEERAIVDDLLSFLADAPDADVARMRPYALADVWRRPRRPTLTLFLRAARAGLLRLSWDVLCPSCEAPTTVRHLRELPAGGHCPACDIDFTTAFEQNVEATFCPEPLVRAAERLVFCHGSPASTKSWLAQFVAPPSSTHELTLRLGIGRYRLQGQGVARPVLVDVAEQGAAAVRIRLAVEGDAPMLSPNTATVGAGDVVLSIENADQRPHRMQLAHRAFASQAATAADVTGVGLFRELFGAEVLAPDQHVAVGNMAILFTDLVGSTAMYERKGDAAAYGVVREHFRLLFAVVEERRGHVVKTVGDCVMAAFDVPVDAARAGLACIEAVRALKDKDGQAPGLRLRVGVHSGPCLAVDANEAIDYFGRTVNIAARVESLGGADELVLSWAVSQAPDVPGFLDELRSAGHTIVTEHRRVKGIDGEVEVTRVGVRAA